MNGPKMPPNRREFLKGAAPVAALAIGAPAWRSLRAAEAGAAASPDPDDPGAQRRPAIQVGILLGTFRNGTIEARLDERQARHGQPGSGGRASRRFSLPG